MVCAIVPSVSITTSAIASRAVSSTCASTRAGVQKVEPALLDESLHLGAARCVGHDDEVERVVDGCLDEQRHVIDHDGRRIFGLGLRDEPPRKLADSRVHDGV